jgi:hypothetical protein
MPEVCTYQYTDSGICDSENPSHRGFYHIIIFQFRTGNTAQTNTSQIQPYQPKKDMGEKS